MRPGTDGALSVAAEGAAGELLELQAAVATRTASEEQKPIRRARFVMMSNVEVGSRPERSDRQLPPQKLYEGSEGRRSFSLARAAPAIARPSTAGNAVAS